MMITGAYSEYMKLRVECIEESGTLPQYDVDLGFIMWLLDLVADGELDATEARKIAISQINDRQ